MAKQCNKEGCNYPVFGGGYCKMHQHYRTDKKPSKIAPRSKKRAKQEKEYSKLSPSNDKCFFCNRGFSNQKPDRHHLDGRKEDKLTDESLLVNVHSECHDLYHHHPRGYEGIMKMTWYQGFMERLADKSEEVHRKHLLREFKVTKQ